MHLIGLYIPFRLTYSEELTKKETCQFGLYTPFWLLRCIYRFFYIFLTVSVLQVFVYLKRLLNQLLFLQKKKNVTWRSVLPHLLKSEDYILEEITQLVAVVFKLIQVTYTNLYQVASFDTLMICEELIVSRFKLCYFMLLQTL